MFDFIRNRSTLATFPADLRHQLDEQDAIVVAERVAVVVHLTGHVPGVFASSSAARFKGAFALTRHRVLATLPTAADPTGRAIDCPWDLPRGAVRVTISETGLTMDIGLRGVDPSFSGSMTIAYKSALDDEHLGRLPAQRLWSPMNPELVYRAAGVRPRN